MQKKSRLLVNESKGYKVINTSEAKKIVLKGSNAICLGTLEQSIAVVKFINQLEDQLT